MAHMVIEMSAQAVELHAFLHIRNKIVPRLGLPHVQPFYCAHKGLTCRFHVGADVL
jgi:hypothetical protein